MGESDAHTFRGEQRVGFFIRDRPSTPAHEAHRVVSFAVPSHPEGAPFRAGSRDPATPPRAWLAVSLACITSARIVLELDSERAHGKLLWVTKGGNLDAPRRNISRYS